MMKKFKLLFISYFSIILIIIQLVISIMFYFNIISENTINFIGDIFRVSLFYSIGWLVLSYSLNFCKISRICSIAEVLFCLSYILLPKAEYNTLLRISLCSLSLVLTYFQYIKLFPHCKMSLIHNFGAIFVTKLDCEVALKEFKEKQYNKAKADITN